MGTPLFILHFLGSLWRLDSWCLGLLDSCASTVVRIVGALGKISHRRSNFYFYLWGRWMQTVPFWAYIIAHFTGWGRQKMRDLSVAIPWKWRPNRRGWKMRDHIGTAWVESASSSLVHHLLLQSPHPGIGVTLGVTDCQSLLYHPFINLCAWSKENVQNS